MLHVASHPLRAMRTTPWVSFEAPTPLGPAHVKHVGVGPCGEPGAVAHHAKHPGGWPASRAGTGGSPREAPRGLVRQLGGAAHQMKHPDVSVTGVCRWADCWGGLGSVAAPAHRATVWPWSAARSSVPVGQELRDHAPLGVGQHDLDGCQALAPPTLATPGPLRDRLADRALVEHHPEDVVRREGGEDPAAPPGAEAWEPWWSRSVTSPSSSTIRRTSSGVTARPPPPPACGCLRFRGCRRHPWLLSCLDSQGSPATSAPSPSSGSTPASTSSATRTARGSTVTGTPLSAALPRRPETARGRSGR